MISRLLIGAANKIGGYPPGNASLADLFGVGRSKISANIGEDSFLGSAPWFCAFDLISSTLGIVEFFAFERLEPSGRRKARELPAYRLVQDAPNDEMTAFDFVKLLTTWKLAWGNAYAEVERNARGAALACWPIHPSRVRPYRTTAGAIRYEVWNDNSTRADIAAADMIHVKNYSKTGLLGIGLIGLAREACGLTVEAEQYGARFFANDARAGVMLTIPGEPTPELINEVRRTWRKEHGGEERGSVGVLHSGITAQAGFSVNNEDSQFTDTRRYQVVEASRFSHVPPHMLMEMSNASGYNSIEHYSIEYVTYAVLPHAIAIEQEFTRKLIPAADQDRFYCKFQLASLLRGDRKSFAEAMHIMRQDGALTADEWREMDELNPLPEGQGAVVLVPVNMEPAAITVEKSKRAASGNDTADTEFKRAVLKAFLADKTTVDVIYNKTNIDRLLADVGLPAEPGYQPPWLPVIADAGPLVTGETITDSEGDIVGGDIEEQPPDANTPPPEPAVPPMEPPEPAPTENMPPGSQRRDTTLALLAGPAADLLAAATRPVIKIELDKLGKLSKKKNAGIDEFLRDHEAFVVASMGPALDMAAAALDAVGGPAGEPWKTAAHRIARSAGAAQVKMIAALPENTRLSAVTDNAAAFLADNCIGGLRQWIGMD